MFRYPMILFLFKLAYLRDKFKSPINVSYPSVISAL